MIHTRIHHWHRRYRVQEPHVSAWERLASGAVLDALDRALAKLLPDDREVVLLRRVNLRFSTMEPDGSHLELADQWGTAMATAVEEALERNDPDNVRRFRDWEEHLVCYLQAVVNGQSPDAWYFRRWHNLHDRASVGSLVECLVPQFPDRWPEVFARLSRRGLVGSIIRQLSPTQRQMLWTVGIRGLTATTDRETERPIFAAALELVARIFDRSFSATERSEAFRDYVSRPLPATDWSDVTHLAEAVYAATRFVVTCFSRTLNDLTDAELQSRLEVAVAGLDWLDREWLRHRLAAFVVCHSSAAAVDQQRRALSPNQAAWQQAWRDIEAQFQTLRDASQPASADNCLLALSLILAKYPHWANEPALPVFVEHQLSQLVIRREPSLTIEAPRMADPTLENAQSAHLAQTQDQGSQLVPVAPIPRSIERTTAESSGAATCGHATEFAGAFLLARSLHDLRLSGLSRRSGFPDATDVAAARLFAELACAWNQQRLPDQFDAGLLEFARLASAVEWTQLATTSRDETQCSEFQVELSRTLVGLGAWIDPARLHVMLHESSGHRWLLGGDVAGRLFPLCVPMMDAVSAMPAIERWLDQLSTALGHSMELLIDEQIATCESHLSIPATLWNLEGDPWWNSESRGPAESVSESTLRATAACVLRHWARSLRGLGGASNEFLLRQLIQRPGIVAVRPGGIEITLQPRPLDSALQVSGLLDNFDYFNGKELRKVSFQIARER